MEFLIEFYSIALNKIVKKWVQDPKNYPRPIIVDCRKVGA